MTTRRSLVFLRAHDLHGRDLLRLGGLTGDQADLIEEALNAKD
jgi:hypothetical protein